MKIFKSKEQILKALAAIHALWFAVLYAYVNALGDVVSVRFAMGVALSFVVNFFFLSIIANAIVRIWRECVMSKTRKNYPVLRFLGYLATIIASWIVMSFIYFGDLLTR